MRKSFYMLAVAVAAMTGCAQSDVLEVARNSKAIDFAPFVENHTKVTHDITDGSTDFAEFYVFGAKGVIDGSGVFAPDADGGDKYLDHVQVSGGKGNWSYSPHVPWIAYKTFRFAAYANGTGSGDVKDPQTQAVTPSNEAKLNNVEFVPEDNNHKWGLNITGYEVGDRDLLVAVPEQKSVTEITTAPSSVGMTFKHVLAKVIFQFRYTANPNNEALTLEIDPFSFNAYRVGNCELRYTGIADNTKIGAEWTPTGTPAAYNFFPVVDGNFQSWTSGNIQSDLYVIPQSNENLTVDNITITSKNSIGEETSVITYNNVSLTIPNHTKWLPGYVYRYIADITPGEHYIHFTTSVTSWIDEDNRNQTIQSATNN